MAPRAEDRADAAARPRTCRVRAHRRARDHRRPAHGRARRHRRHDRLVLLPAVRLAERVRVDPRRGAAAATTGSRPRPDEWTVKQLYFPDTNVLDHALPLRRTASARSRTSCRSTTAGVAHRQRLIRRVIVRARRDALPRRVRAALRLRRAPSTQTSQHEHGVRLRSARPHASPSRRPCRSSASTARRTRRVRARARARARPSSSSSRADDAAAALLRGRDARGVRARRSRTGGAGSPQSQLPGPLARDGAPLGADAEAADLPAHRRDRRRADDEPARAASAASATGTTATPGSATPPSRCTRCCGSASPRRPRRSWAG